MGLVMSAISWPCRDTEIKGSGGRSTSWQVCRFVCGCVDRWGGGTPFKIIGSYLEITNTHHRVII